MKPLRSIVPFVVALGVALFVAGCNMPSFAYRNAPALIGWRANSYLDLDSAQQAEFKARLERVHAWHRDVELPRLIALLRDARSRVSRELTVADAEWLVESMQERYRAAAGRLVDESADLAARLRPAQIDALERKLADVDREFVEEWIEPPADRVRRARFERVQKRAEEWLGRLEPAQRKWLRERLDRLPVDYHAARTDRLRRQAELVAALRGEPAFVRTGGGDSRHARLKRWAIDWDHGRSARELGRIDRFVTEYAGLYVALINEATPAQRRHLGARLDAYIDALSAQLK